MNDGPRLKCKACDHDVVPGRFCANCGLTLPTFGRSELRCSTCAAQLAHDASYCTDCGNPAPRV